jgi:hypothetical protein
VSKGDELPAIDVMMREIRFKGPSAKKIALHKFGLNE